MTTIGFLHTAQIHVPVFEQLGHAIDPSVTFVHEVQPDLLQIAMKRGVTDEVVQGVNASLHQLVDQGCSAISCTCSTLGSLVEDRVIGGIKIQRIDRAIADHLMAFERVLVLAAIESAAEAADKLLDGSARKTGASTGWLVALVPGAWPLFESGQLESYEKTVANFANQFTREYDAIFLSQASMQGAVNLCEHEQVMTSPEAGVQRLLGQ